MQSHYQLRYLFESERHVSIVPYDPVTSTYRLLRLSLHEHVAVSQVVDLDVLYVVAVRHIHLAGRTRRAFACFGSRRAGLGGAIVHGALDGRNVDVLDALAGLELRVDFRGGRSCRSTSQYGWTGICGATVP